VVCDSIRERTKSLEREKVFHEIIKKKNSTIFENSKF
jgi:hypothetical protein